MVDKNFQSKTGESFSAENLAVVFKKGQLVLDFRKTAPRLDNISGDKKQTVVSEHQPIVLNPKRAKAVKNALEKNIERYEEKYGEIEYNPSQSDSAEEGESKQSDPDSQDYIA